MKKHLIVLLLVPFCLDAAVGGDDSSSLKGLYDMVPGFDKDDEQAIFDLQRTLPDGVIKLVTFGENNTLFLFEKGPDGKTVKRMLGKEKPNPLMIQDSSVSLVNGLLMVDLSKHHGKDLENEVNRCKTKVDKLLNVATRSDNVQSGLMIRVTKEKIHFLVKKVEKQ